MAIELNQNNFKDEILMGEGVSLVDFWAPWCGPCRKQLPIVEALSEEIGNRAKIGKVNVEENNELAGEYQITSIPALLIFKNGQIVDRLSGLHSKEQLIAQIKQHS